MVVAGKGCVSLPQQVNCYDCGAILYKGEDLKSPEEILQIHEGKCPKCGKRLSLMPQGIDVKPVKDRPVEKYPR